jgi:hypothetical protein
MKMPKPLYEIEPISSFAKIDKSGDGDFVFTLARKCLPKENCHLRKGEKIHYLILLLIAELLSEFRGIFDPKLICSRCPVKFCVHKTNNN